MVKLLKCIHELQNLHKNQGYLKHTGIGCVSPGLLKLPHGTIKLLFTNGYFVVSPSFFFQLEYAVLCFSGFNLVALLRYLAVDV